MFLEILIIYSICNAPNVFSQNFFKNRFFNGSLVQEEEEKITKTTEQFSTCFENLGCIRTTDEWVHPIHRPRNLKPLHRNTIRTQFVVINIDPESGKSLRYDTLRFKKGHVYIDDYKITDKIVILIHDFTSNGYTGWVKHISAAYIVYKGYSNIISVDWEAGAEPPYEQAVANARVVALETVALINVLQQKQGSNPMKIHLIGHGVGAHIAGYVGTSVKIGKITGLDPTGPLFSEMPPIVRLDKTDAKFVEVLHTDAFNSRSQGALQQFGHFDFYINGAKLQPLCNQSSELPPFTHVSRDMLQEGVILPACSHKRSFKYFVEAIQHNNCEFTGFRCRNYQDFIEGKCIDCLNQNNNISCATFGVFNPPELKENYTFYLNTQGKPEYCLNPYLVKISIGGNVKPSKTQKGHFQITILDKSGNMVRMFGTNEGYSSTYEGGHSYTFIYYASPPRICNIVEVRLKWIQKPQLWCFGLCTRSIYITEIFIKLISIRKLCDAENRLCPLTNNSEIENDSYGVFVTCNKTTVNPQPFLNSTIPSSTSNITLDNKKKAQGTTRSGTRAEQAKSTVKARNG